MKLAELDSCAVPAKLEPILAEIKQETGCVYASIYRGSDAAAILNAHGKHTQQQLWDASPSQRSAWGVLGTPNPPGQSTHELRSDGVAYPGPAGRPLMWWQCGIDVDDAHVAAFIAAAAKHGWVAFRPYSAGVEYHHVDFKKLPVFFSPDYKPGAKGPNVLLFTQRLVKLGYLKRRWWQFNATVEQAVKLFQRDHHFTPDGVVGPVTWQAIKALAASKRRFVKHPAKPVPKKPPAKKPQKPAAISSAVVSKIAEFEGGQGNDGLFHPYTDPVGVWTIGYGHTEGVSSSSHPLTKTQALALLKHDLNTIYVPDVQAAAAKYGWQALTANQLGALTSFCYNLGAGYFEPSHSLGGALRNHDVKGAAAAILLYDKAGSPPRSLPGLTTRRRWEHDLFLQGASK